MTARDRRHAEAESAKGGWQHPSTYATAYDACSEIAKFQEQKRSTKVALREQSRGVSSYHVFVRAFGDAYYKRENVRHATFLFCAFGGGPWQMSKAVGKKRLMATVKAMVAEKLRQEGRSADDNTIKGIVHRYLKDICRFFPDETSESKEFMGVLSEFRVNANSGATNEENAEALMERTINALLEKIMYERHDLCDEKYKNLREKLIESITKNWRN